MSDTLRDTVDLLGELVACPTVSADSNLAMIAALAQRLEDCGARVEVLADESGAKANLFATLGPDRPGGVVLSGHSDVVPVEDQDWTGDPFTLRERAGRLYGRGTCDMKGFIAAACVAARGFSALPLHRPLHFAFTYDEEVGCLGARALIPALAERGVAPAVTLVGEPTGMQVIEGHKGCCEYTARFSGHEGHGSAPERGVNAVEYAVRYVARLLELRAELQARAPANSRFEPPWSTLSIGRIAGGVAHNVIAGTAEVAWEMRPVQDADLRHVRDAMAHHVSEVLLPEMRAIWPAANITVETIGEVVGLEPMPENAARDLLMRLLGANGADVVAFGSEAGLFRQLGSDVVVCGPGFIEQAHKADEYVSVDQLRACAGMLERLGRWAAEAA